jgi:hypothetical protein
MRHAPWVVLLMLAGGLAACTGTPDAEAPAAEVPPTPVEDASFPDPGPDQAMAVETFVQAWIAEHSEGEVFAIPPRAGHEVSGRLESFHTVHQQDDDTYNVCVDFVDGDNTYDVDFFVDLSPEGFTMDDQYLHKVNGELVG